MPFFTTILLLAACSTTVIAGPVPHDRRQLLTRYANTTSNASPTTQIIQTTESIAAPSQTLSSSIPKLVNADTALVIEPIQKTVITQINPAITFQNPKGEPIASQGAETVLITSYFTPTPAPVASSSAITSSSTLPSPSPFSSQVLSSSQSSGLLFTIISSSALPQSSQAAVESGRINSTSIPSFTYSPQEGESGVPVASPTLIVTSKVASGNSTELPGFNQPSPISHSAKVTSVLPSSAAVESSSVIKTPVQAPSPTVPLTSSLPVSSSSSSSVGNTPATTTLNATGSKSRVVITKTLYTTVYPSSQQSSPTPSKSPELGGPAQPDQSSLSSAYTPTAPSPSPLAPPPVVIVTQYTTVAPSLSLTVQPSQVPDAPNTPIVPSPFSSGVPASSSAVAVPPSSSPAQTSPSASSPQSPVSLSSLTITPTLSSSPIQSAAPPAASSTTSDGPLVITPIAPSQIFTVTVTATQKETVTETATVSVTVRA